MIKFETNPAPEPFSMRANWAAMRTVPQIPVEDLAGTTVVGLFDDARLELTFAAESVHIVLTSDAYQADFTADDLDFVQPRPNIRYFDLVDNASSRSLTVVEHENGSLLAVFNDLEYRDGQQNLVQRTYSGVSGTAAAGAPQFQLSKDLNGKRAVVTYREGHVLEHIYVNSGSVAWQLLQGRSAPGHAEAHPSTIWKLDEGLYFLGWVEYRPIAVLLVMDFTEKRNVGKVLAVDDEGFVNERAGARIDHFGEVASYPDGSAPV